jgi:catechol 2,3-dioxygenase-like lactoylglutathione lyase family enzyme
MRAQPLIAVADVQKSSRWYQELLGCQSGHGGNQYEQLVKDGRLLLQLHQWDEHDHPNLSNSSAAPHGFGVLLWFETDHFDDAVLRVRGLAATVLDEPHVNSNAKHREVWLRDLDGYVVVLASPYGDINPGRR